MKGEEKSRTQKQCFYGPDGKVQKQPLSAPPQQAAPGGVKGKLVEKKKAEITATMTQAVDLVHQYVPPDPQRIQAAKSAGNLAMTPSGPNSARLDLKNYLKPGDTLSLGLDTAGNALQTVSVKSYLADAVRRGHAGRDVRAAARRALVPGQRRAERARPADSGRRPELQLPEGGAGWNRAGPDEGGASGRPGDGPRERGAE